MPGSPLASHSRSTDWMCSVKVVSVGSGVHVMRPGVLAELKAKGRNIFSNKALFAFGILSVQPSVRCPELADKHAMVQALPAKYSAWSA